MTTWIQSSDFTSDDIKHLEQFRDFDVYIDKLLKEPFDKMMQEFDSLGKEYCPWGIGINMDSDYGLHIIREDVSKNTYAVLTQETIKKKVFGFIPISKSNEKWESGLSYNQMKIAVSDYYSQKQKL
jgi:hypothetical protein